MLGERMFVPASLVVVLAGIGLMLDGNWDWDQLWVIFALVTFAASFATGLLVIAPMAKRIPVVGPTTPVGQSLIQRLFTILRIDLVYMYAIVFAMVVKPTTDDGWTIAIVAAVLVASTVVFLAPLRATSASLPRQQRPSDRRDFLTREPPQASDRSSDSSGSGRVG